jgi:hypothetical protein
LVAPARFAASYPARFSGLIGVSPASLAPDAADATLQFRSAIHYDNNPFSKDGARL